MKLNKKEIEEMSSKEIFEFLSPMICSIYQSFKYTKISKQKYNNLVLEEIEKSKEEFTDNIPYSLFLKKKLETILREYTKQLLSNSNTAYETISNYIKQEFTDISNYKNAIQYFKQIDTFLKKHKFIAEPDILIKLIKENNIFNHMIESIVKHYYSRIITENTEQIFDNDLLTLTVEIYCASKNIKIKEIELKEMREDIEIMDSTKSYLKEIEKIPLLSAEQEKELLKKIEMDDEEAKQLFIESNLRLVVSVAVKYQNRGLPFLDLIQEGNLGLMEAVNRYDRKLGYRFSTYGVFWIRQSITRSIAEKSRNLRIPVYLNEKVNLLKKTITSLENKLNREPKTEEIAKEMNLSIKEVIKLQKYKDDTISINILVGEDQETELETFIPSPEEKSLEDVVIDATLPFLINKLFDDCNLTQREKEILMLRNGFRLQSTMSLEEVGKIFHLTKERIRQIEAKAIRKIRNSVYIKDLIDYMDNPENALKKIAEFREEYGNSITSYKSYPKKKIKTIKKN